MTYISVFLATTIWMVGSGLTFAREGHHEHHHRHGRHHHSHMVPSPEIDIGLMSIIMVGVTAFMVRRRKQAE
jgi:hypothetical protein